MDKIFFIIALLGCTHIVTGTFIFQWLRTFAEKYSPNFFGILFSCPTCFGFWVGIIFTVLNLIPDIGLQCNFYSLILYIGSVSSGINWLTHLLVDLIEERIYSSQLKREQSLIEIEKIQMLND